MKQQVISYEYEILHNSLISKSQLKRSPSADPHRYSMWRLNQTLHSLVNDPHQHQLQWMGNSPHSYILAYFYCIMMVCSQKPETLMQVKHSIYKFCQYCLNLAEQRYLVEFMNMIQKDRSVEAIMKNNQHIEEFLIKIYECSLNMIKVGSDAEPYEKLILYSRKLFPFLYIYTAKEGALGIKVEDKDAMYIVKEKDCYFVYYKQYKIKTQQKKRPKFIEKPKKQEIIKGIKPLNKLIGSDIKNDKVEKYRNTSPQIKRQSPTYSKQKSQLQLKERQSGKVSPLSKLDFDRFNQSSLKRLKSEKLSPKGYQKQMFQTHYYKQQPYQK